MNMGVLVLPSLHKACRCHPLCQSRGVPQRETVKPSAIESNSVRNSLGVDLKGLRVDVRRIVTSLVVVDIVRDASLTAEQSRLLLGLEHLGSGEQATSGDARSQKWTVVAAPGERSRDAVVSLRVEPGRERSLCLRRASWARLKVGELAAVAIVNAEDVVGAGNHVVVKLQTNAVQLLLAGVLVDIRSGSKQTFLLSSPPAELDCGNSGVPTLGELDSRLQNTS